MISRDKDMPDINDEYVMPTGLYIADRLSSRGISLDDFCRQTGIEKGELNELIKSKIPVRYRHAEILEKVLNIPIAFWFKYDEIFTRYRYKKEMDIKVLKALGIIREYCSSKNKCNMECALYNGTINTCKACFIAEKHLRKKSSFYSRFLEFVDRIKNIKIVK